MPINAFIILIIGSCLICSKLDCSGYSNKGHLFGGLSYFGHGGWLETAVTWFFFSSKMITLSIRRETANVARHRHINQVDNHQREGYLLLCNLKGEPIG